MFWLNSESVTSSVNIFKFFKDCDRNNSTMECLISDNVVSKEMVNKISKSGLCLQHLQLAISCNSTDGLTQMLKEKSFDGKPTVTSLKRITESVLITQKRNKLKESYCEAIFKKCFCD